MVQLWKRWCRLCAREDPFNTHINVFLNETIDQELFDNINRIFTVEVNNSNNFPTVVCVDCYHLIKSTIILNDRIPKVTTMYRDLLSRQEEDFDFSKIKASYNLDWDFKLFTLENVDIKPKDEVLEDVAEQMIDEEFTGRKTLEPNPINIKTEEEGNLDGLFSHSDSISNENVSPENSMEETIKIKRKYKTKKERLAENQKKPYSCSDCIKGFMKFSNYRLHMQSTHNVVIEVKPPNLTCDNCGKEHKTISALKEHQLSHTDERNLKCKYCEKKFKGLPSLKRHEDTHNDTNYICVVCGLQLNTKLTLRRHMVVHSDQKNHKCDFCGNEYKRAKSLKTHLILHAGLKPYSCDFCEKTFANGANCRSHKRKYHPTELAEHEAAGKSQTSKTVIPKLRDLKAVLVKKAKNGLILASKSKTRKNGVKKAENSEPAGHEKYSSKEEPDYFRTILGPWL